MVAGVPYVPTAVVVAVVYVGLVEASTFTGQAVVVAIGGAIFAALRLIAAGDPQIFRVIGVWLMTRFVWHPGSPFGPLIYGPPARERPSGARR